MIHIYMSNLIIHVDLQDPLKEVALKYFFMLFNYSKQHQQITATRSVESTTGAHQRAADGCVCRTESITVDGSLIKVAGSGALSSSHNTSVSFQMSDSQRVSVRMKRRALEEEEHQTVKTSRSNQLKQQ